jgi:hypothetical protein
MARYTSDKARLGAVQDYLELRRARDRSIAGRRALAAAEASLAEELRATGRHITDDATELSVRANGGIRVRTVRTEPREPRVPGRRAIERARRYGFTEGDDATLRALGQEIRRTLRSLGKDQIEVILQDARERLEASLADDDDFDTEPTSPAKSTPTPTPTSSTPATGWGADGVFRASRSQLRDPAWAMQPANQASLVKAGGKLVVID